MNYLKIYNQLVQKRKQIEPTQYFQKHHIKPRSLFPDLIRDKNNIVKLTYREHYIAHWLLTKIYPSKEMTHAFWRMNCCNNDLYFNSYAFQICRKAFIESNKGQGNPMYGKHGKRRHHTEQTRRKMSEALKGKNFSEAHKRKIGEANKGKHRSEEIKKKLSEANTGQRSPNFGKHLIFINNGKIKKKIELSDPIPEGFNRGRLKKE